MSVLSAIKSLLTEDIKNKINDKINEIGDCSDLSQFDVGIILDNLDVSSLKYEEILLERDRAKFLAKVSLDLWNDFEHYRQFRLKSLDETDEVKERMTNLGYECKNHSWESILRPKICDVQTNILLYCFCESIFIKMEYNDENLQNIKNEELQMNFIRDDGVNVEKRSVPFVIDSNIKTNNVKSAPNNNNVLVFTLLDYCKITNNSEIWTCDYCRVNNNHNNQICEGCFKDKSNNFLLFIDKGMINIIENINKEEIKENTSDEGNVEVTCSLRNNEKTLNEKEEEKNISNHNFIKYKKENNLGNVSNLWSCKFCTFINNSRSTICEVCYLANNQFNKNKEDKLESDNGLPSFVTQKKDPHQISETRSNNKESYTNHILRSASSLPFIKEKVECSETVYENIPFVIQKAMKKLWKCKSCSKDNSYERYMCVSCRVYAPFFKKWVCERCSFFNDEMSRNCVKCKLENIHLKMCSKCKKEMNVDEGYLCQNCKNKNSQIIESIGAEKVGRNIISKNKQVSESKEEKWMDNKYYCNNRWCGIINNSKNRHCSKCKLKKDATITFFNMVDVFNGNTYVKMWQCTFCGDFNTKDICEQCKNMRNDPSYKRCCRCNWVNIKDICGNCKVILESNKRES